METKKPYVPPTIEKREQLSDVTKGPLPTVSGQSQNNITIDAPR